MEPPPKAPLTVSDFGTDWACFVGFDLLAIERIGAKWIRLFVWFLCSFHSTRYETTSMEPSECWLRSGYQQQSVVVALFDSCRTFWIEAKSFLNWFHFGCNQPERHCTNIWNLLSFGGRQTLSKQYPSKPILLQRSNSSGELSLNKSRFTCWPRKRHSDTNTERRWSRTHTCDKW